MRVVRIKLKILIGQMFKWQSHIQNLNIFSIKLLIVNVASKGVIAPETINNFVTKSALTSPLHVSHNHCHQV